MLDGNISNVPAPVAHFDGASFVYKYLLTYKRLHGWEGILRSFYREYTVHFWFDPEWFRFRNLSRSHRCFKDLWFNDIVIEPVKEMSWRLHKTRSRIISAREYFIKKCPHVSISIKEPMERLRAAV